MTAEMPAADSAQRALARAAATQHRTMELLDTAPLTAGGWQPVTSPGDVHDGETVYASIRGLRRPAVVVGRDDSKALFLAYCTKATGRLVRVARVHVSGSRIAAAVYHRSGPGRVVPASAR